MITDDRILWIIITFPLSSAYFLSHAGTPSKESFPLLTPHGPFDNNEEVSKVIEDKIQEPVIPGEPLIKG